MVDGVSRKKKMVKGVSLEHGCRCIAGAVLCIPGTDFFVAARLSVCFSKTKNALLDRLVCL